MMTTPTTWLDGLRERADELLPCRQCNYSAPPLTMLGQERKHYHAHAYKCQRCGFQSETGATWDEARAKWNTRDLLTALSAAPPGAEGWRPIETAPVDDWVLLSTWGGHVGQAIYGEDEENPQWRWASDAPGARIHRNLKPLGWQPLPAPPAASPAPAQDAATGGEPPEKVWAREARQIACNLMDPTHSTTASRNDAAFFLGYIANKLDTRTPSPDARELVERAEKHVVYLQVEKAQAGIRCDRFYEAGCRINIELFSALIAALTGASTAPEGKERPWKPWNTFERRHGVIEVNQIAGELWWRDAALSSTKASAAPTGEDRGG